ncbi:MAG: D-cysteine desulfhydrase [Actinomycetota bacterium]|jgi:D-cysteine desulfhydrase|nr:D-cysteine desulfhydrase [Actinomycetota bacterium]
MVSGPALERRIPLVSLPTPLEPLDRLGAALGMRPGSLWAKRDDVNGLALGGNKARKLEYLCADALAQGCDTLVTGGGQQSNHVRMTAAAACRLGLDCVVVVPGHRPETPTGNVLLDEMFDPDIIWLGRPGVWAGQTGSDDPGIGLDHAAIEHAIDAACTSLAAEGRRPYGMPVGGASAVGALGYARAALELATQAGAMGGEADLIVLADGSGGTHAGLAAGLGGHDRILGIDIGARPDLDTHVPAKAREVAALAGLPEPTGPATIDHGRFGRHYGDLTEPCREAILLAARTEGLVLDPVYTGKAMAGLVAARREGRIGPGTRTVFLHTGGAPGLFAAGMGTWVRHGNAGAPTPTATIRSH